MIDLDAVRDKWRGDIVWAEGQTVSDDTDATTGDWVVCFLAIRDLIDEVERLRADATRAEADLTEDCTRLMRERDEARAEVERLRAALVTIQERT